MNKIVDIETQIVNFIINHVETSYIAHTILVNNLTIFGTQKNSIILQNKKHEIQRNINILHIFC